LEAAIRARNEREGDQLLQIDLLQKQAEKDHDYRNAVLKDLRNAQAQVEGFRYLQREAKENIRVLRLVEYSGPRAQVEEQVKISVHGSKPGLRGVTITAVTLHEYPLALEQVREAVRTSRLSTIGDMATRELATDKAANPLPTREESRG
jgi:hypothetical protein